MIINYTKSYDNTIKKLKKYPKELDNLENIKSLIKESINFIELSNNPLATMYSFERLKHKNNDYWSFNLSKHGGVIRLIVKPTENDNIILLAFVSYNHYKDFIPNKLVYYDE